MASMYPPYPEYDDEPTPPSVADAIVAGRNLAVQHKSGYRPPVRAPPKPARPRTPKVTDVKMARRALKAHARCLRRHGAVLTDRLEWLAKPRRRNVIYLWRDHADILPPEAIERFRAMLNADEPFKPDQAYEYFINCRKAKKKPNAMTKRDANPVGTDKRFVWARNATVAFARGVQQRLSRPGRYSLADGMLRLSDVILAESCGYMKMRTPSRRSTNSKDKFMMEMSDKIAVWIDEILSESDDRMLMMDFDEDEDVERSEQDKNKPLATPTTSDETISPAPSKETVTATPSAATVAAKTDAIPTEPPAVTPQATNLPPPPTNLTPPPTNLPPPGPTNLPSPPTNLQPPPTNLPPPPTNLPPPPAGPGPK